MKSLPIFIHARPIEQEPEIPIFDLDIKSPNEPYAEILLSTCWHVGHKNFEREALFRYLNLFYELHHLRGVFLGDAVDATSFRPGYLGESIVPEAQLEELAQILAPVAKKHLVWLIGNHDARFQQATFGAINWVQWLLRSQLGSNAIVPNEPGRGIMAVFRVNKQEYTAYMSHTRGGAISNELSATHKAKLNQLVALVATGHNHRQAWRPIREFAPTQRGKKWYLQTYETIEVSTGTFLGPPAYGEEVQYPQTDVGAYMVRFHSDEAKIEIIEPETQYAELMNTNKYHPDTNIHLNLTPQQQFHLNQAKKR